MMIRAGKREEVLNADPCGCAPPATTASCAARAAADHAHHARPGHLRAPPRPGAEEQPTAQFAQLFWNNMPTKTGRVNELKLGLSCTSRTASAKASRPRWRCRTSALGMLKTKRLSPMELWAATSARTRGMHAMLKKAQSHRRSQDWQSKAPEERSHGQEYAILLPRLFVPEGGSASNYLVSVESRCARRSTSS
jgi:quinone-modifying oxidoreductase, subunit QmoC